MSTQRIPLSQLLPPTSNPRRRIDPAGIQGLATPIQTDGVLQNLVVKFHCYPGVRVLEIAIEVPQGWLWTQGRPVCLRHLGHFGRGSPLHHRLHMERRRPTHHLRETLRAGQAVTVEGPYGCFTFDDSVPLQIWVGGGIGVTPFIARMKDLAA